MDLLAANYCSDEDYEDEPTTAPVQKRVVSLRTIALLATEGEDEEQIYIYKKNRNYVDILEPKYVKIYDDRNAYGLPDIVPIVRDQAVVQAVRSIKTRIFQSPALYARFTHRR
jgi:hypothetical protein